MSDTDPTRIADYVRRGKWFCCLRCPSKVRSEGVMQTHVKVHQTHVKVHQNPEQHAEYVPFNGWHFQVAIWGYSLLGDVLEQDALMGEYQDSYPLWDQTRRDLDSCVIDRGNGWERVPDWYALHHLPMPVRERAYAAHIDGSPDA